MIRVTPNKMMFKNKMDWKRIKNAFVFYNSHNSHIWIRTQRCEPRHVYFSNILWHQLVSNSSTRCYVRRKVSIYYWISQLASNSVERERGERKGERVRRKEREWEGDLFDRDLLPTSSCCINITVIIYCSVTLALSQKWKRNSNIFYRFGDIRPEARALNSLFLYSSSLLLSRSRTFVRNDFLYLLEPIFREISNVMMLTTIISQKG